jgi:hypothetical protein
MPAPTLAQVRNYKDAVAVHPSNLQQDVEQQAAQFAWYSELRATAQKEVAQLKLREDVLVAELGKEARLELQKRDVRVTEDQVKEYRKGHKMWQAHQARLIDAIEVEAICDGVVRALDQKSRMLQALVTMRRAEWAQPGDEGLRSDRNDFVNRRNAARKG